MSSLPRSVPSAAGVDASGILAFLDALEAAPDTEPHGLMILRHGHVVAQGWWRPYSPERVHLLYSLSKSFTASAVALAVAEGLVDLDHTVLSYFPELDAEVTDPRSRSMLVRHVAAMSSGHHEETLLRAQALDPVDLVRGFLLIPPDQEPGTVFAYNQPCTFALAAIVQRTSGQSLTEFLRPRLFDPLGIGETGWTRDASGRELGYSGLHATTEAVARLGQLYLQEGRWQGRQLLDRGWVAEATRSHIGTSTSHTEPDWQQGYGFQFWMARHGYRGDGAYGQFCVILPEQDAVIAITSQTMIMQVVLDAAWAHLLPAFTDAAAIAPTDADAVLAERLSRLQLPPSGGGPAPADTRPQTFTAAPGNDQPGLTQLVLSAEADGRWLITLVDGYSRIDARLGIGEWQVTDAVATSGGWVVTGAEGHHLQIEIAFLETPHRLKVVCRPGSDTFEARWMTAPLWPGSLAELRMPASS